MALFATTPDKVQKWIDQGNAKKLIAALSSPDAVVRRLSAEGLGRIGGSEVMDYCKKNITNMDDTVRWHVTQILGLIGTPDAIKLMEMSGHPTDVIREKIKKEQ